MVKFSAILISLKGQYAPLKSADRTGGSLIFTNSLKLVVAGIHVFGATVVITRAKISSVESLGSSGIFV